MLLGPHLPREIETLEVLATGDLWPLTQAPPLAVERLALAMGRDRIQRHPLLVTNVGNRCIVLDGNARLAAARQIGLPDLLVQVVPQDRLRSPLSVYPLMVLNVQDEEIRRVTREAFDTDPAGSGAALELRYRGGQRLACHPPAGRPEWLWQVFSRIVNALRGVADLEPVPKAEAWADTHQWPQVARALLVPPPLSTEVLGRIAEAEIQLPSGVLHTASPRRILGLNLSLDVLMTNVPRSEKTAFVRELVRLRQSERRIHFYDSPIYLFED
jgi:hypothetical protein